MGVSAPLIRMTDLDGVYASGIHCGIKSEKKDLAYIYIPDTYSSAGVFTQNKVLAPSVIHTQKAVKRHTVKAMIINSGNANTGVGRSGSQNTQKMVMLTAQLLGLNKYEVGVSSTGIIGVPLSMQTVEAGIRSLLEDPRQRDAEAAAAAILTTDLCVKEYSVSAVINGHQIVVTGFTKGSGMIAPNMATTLGYVVTNARIPGDVLQRSLYDAVKHSYNMISVDTDTSTSDMLMAFSTGQYVVPAPMYGEWRQLLSECCTELAQMIVKDGEGATRLIEVKVQGAATKSDARKIAKSVVESPLVKTAVYGADPNWGRILMALGKPDVKVNVHKLDIALGDETMFSNGDAVIYNVQRVTDALKSKKVVININLHLGSAHAVAWGCDLTERYITINTDYS